MDVDLSRIPVALIKRSPLDFSQKLPAGLFDSEDGIVEGDVLAEGEVYESGTEILADVDLEATLVLECSRCLEKRLQPMSKELELTLEHEKNAQYVDLFILLREEVLIERPIQWLCRKDCRGLCPRCGANLNDKKCHCGKK